MGISRQRFLTRVLRRRIEPFSKCPTILSETAASPEVPPSTSRKSGTRYGGWRHTLGDPRSYGERSVSQLRRESVRATRIVY